MSHSIKDIKLAGEGQKKADWAFRKMDVLGLLRKDYSKTKPFKNMQVGCCLHITSETANLAINLKMAGAKVALCASNPLSTQDAIAAYLVKNHGIEVFGIRGDNKSAYYSNLSNVMKRKPHLVVDDGADLIASMHQNTEYAENLIGATEETTTGVIRLKSLAAKNKLMFPVVAVNDAMTKHLFDNRYGTGQSTIDGIMRATNILFAGSTAVVCGYGWCGRGIASRFRGMGAHVIVTETDPLRALEAVMDGYIVMPILEAAEKGDVFVTATGDISVISSKVITRMKDGAILANSGHFNVEIDTELLEKRAKKKVQVRENLYEYKLAGSKSVYLLGEGRLVNLACAEGHPSAVMDMSFANQFLALEYLKDNRNLCPQVYGVPEEVDARIAKQKLQSMGVDIDELTAKQKKYLSSWTIGT